MAGMQRVDDNAAQTGRAGTSPVPGVPLSEPI